MSADCCTDCNFIALKGIPYKYPNIPKPTMLIASAILHDGKLWTGKRHGCILIQMSEAGAVVGRVTQDEQGFYTDKGHFVTREASKHIAWLSGQIPKDFNKRVLLSEHLWK